MNQYNPPGYCLVHAALTVHLGFLDLIPVRPLMPLLDYGPHRETQQPILLTKPAPRCCGTRRELRQAGSGLIAHTDVRKYGVQDIGGGKGETISRGPL